LWRLFLMIFIAGGRLEATKARARGEGHSYWPDATELSLMAPLVSA
jgi:hypothetical protein